MPLFIPHTPGEELVKRIRAKEAENNQGRRIRFKIVGRRGVTLEERLKRSNPWAGERCGREECFQCKAEVVVEIALGKVFVMTCDAMNVEWRCAPIKGSPAGMVLREVSSTKPCSKPEMRRGQSSGFTLFIITRAGRT